MHRRNSRFQCTLGEHQLHYSPLKDSQIFNVGCALHNLCLHFSVEDNFPEIQDETRESSSDFIPPDYHNVTSQIRENILNTFP